MSFAIERERANALLTEAIEWLNRHPRGPGMKEHAIGAEIGSAGRAMISQIRTRPDVLPAPEKQLALIALAEHFGWQGWELYKAEQFGLPYAARLNGTTNDEDHAIHDNTTVARLAPCHHQKIASYKVVFYATQVAIQEVINEALETTEPVATSARPGLTGCMVPA